MPQIIVKKRNVKEATEGLERSRLLAKQVLSQLSYTPVSWLLEFIFYHLRSNFNRPRTAARRIS
jgi:hypothetical protein